MASVRKSDAQRLLFISWAPHCSRSDGIAQRLGGRSFMVYAGWLGSHYFTVLLKYAVQAIRTLWILLKFRPRAVLVMAPPVIACFPVWVYCLLFRARFAIDAHTGAFLDPRWTRLQFLQRFVSRRAATTIVTNEFLRDQVVHWGANATIVPDVPVCFPEADPAKLRRGFNMTVVASFCPDEPIAEIMTAAANVPEANVYVTGDSSRLSAELIQACPSNVRFLGFLSREEYVAQLLGSDAVIALTTRDHTMQRAAYEAIYLGRPVITSDFPVLRGAFAKGTVHVQPTAIDIARGIRDMAAHHEQYRQEAELLRLEKLQRWKRDAAAIRKCLNINDDHKPSLEGSAASSIESELVDAVSIRR